MKKIKSMNKKLTAIVASALLAATVVSPLPANADTTILNSTFENGVDGWSTMGNCKVMQASWVKHNGNSCLYIGSRQQNWNGALYNLSGKVQPGQTYEISAYWMSYQIYNSENVKLTLSYKDRSGQTKYINIAENTGSAQQWVNLKGKVTIPSDASQPVIYFETTKNNYDLYVDDITITQISNGGQQQGGQQQGGQQQGGQQQGGQQQGGEQQYTGSMKQISDAYMANMKNNIQTFCPSNVSAKRNNVQYGSFQHKTYYSSTARKNKGFNILLPPNYNPQKKYPVLYVLHGVMGDENSMVGNGIEYIVGNLVADGKAKDMIVVLPSMYSANDGSQPALNQQGMEGYDRFVYDLKNDLMPYIQKNYSVSTDKKDTAIAGFSMGGRETLYIGVTNSNIFGYVGAFAPAPGATPGQDYIMYHKGQLQESQFKIADSDMPYVLMICGGTNDQVVGTFPQKYHEILTRNNTNHIWYTVPGAGHDNTTISSGLNNFIAGIFHA